MSSAERAAMDGAAASQLAAGVERMLAAAERAARRLIDEAEQEARRRLREADARAERLLAERQAALTALTEDLRRHAEAIDRRAERLLAALEAAERRIEAGEGAAVATPEREHAAIPEPQPARRRAHLSAVAPESGREPAGARLLATQMAVSGSSREEIDRKLRNGFEIEDTSSILDAILGPED